MSIKYYDIIGKVIHVDDVECIKEKILDLPTHELDSCVVHAMEQYVEYCQKHRFSNAVRRLYRNTIKN